MDNEHEIVVGTADGRILFFDMDVEQHPVLEVMDSGKAKITSCECSPNGKYLAIGAADGSIAVYGLGVERKGNGFASTCKAMVRIPCHSGPVTRCTWTGDTKQLVTASGGGDLLVWNLFVE
jgi:WD40 repeat protein